MGIWDDIWRTIRQDEDDEQKRDQKGGLKNKAAGFVDDVFDFGERTAKKAKPVTDFAVEVARGIPRGVIGMGQSMTETQTRTTRDKLDADIDAFQKMSYDDRKKAMENDPSLRTTLKIYGAEDPSDEALKRIKERSQKKVEQSRSFIPDNKAEKVILGDKPVESIQKRREGYEQAVETSPGWSGVKGAAGPLSYLGAVGATALDVPGVGAGPKAVGKKLAKDLAETPDEIVVRESLRGKFASDVIDRIAPSIARTTDEKQVKKITDAADSGLAMSAINRLVGRDTVANAVAETNPADELVQAITPTGARKSTAELTSQYGTSRNTPATTPKLPDDDPIRPLEDMQNADEDVLARMRSGEQVEAMQAKKGWRQRVYEGLFNRDAPLDEFSRRYTEKTGGKLAAADDPAAWRQLANGLDDSNREQIAPVMDALGGLYKGGTDDVRVLGESQQILDRADKYAPEIVQRAEAAIQAIRSKRRPEEVEQAEAAVNAVRNHHDTLLRMLVDSGDLTEEAYSKIKETNPNFFSKRNVVEYLANGSNRQAFSVGSRSSSKDKILQAVKGMQDEQYEILDPLESMLNTTRSVMDRVNKSKMFDAAERFKEIDPSLVVPLRNADDVLQRMSLSSENRELRKVANKVDKLIGTRERWLRRLQSEVNRFEKEGLKLSLKKGGVDSTPQFTSSGLGGKVPTSQAGKNVPTSTEERAILKEIGDEIPVNPSKLGPQDTAAFVRSLVEAPLSEIQKLKKKVGSREGRMTELLDDLEALSLDYDDALETISRNKDEFQTLLDKDVPKGYKAVSRIRKGVQERIALPEEIADTWMGLNEAQRDTVGKVAKYVAQPLRAAVTTLSLPFQFVKNPIRDARQTAITSKAIPVWEYVTVLPYMKRWAQGFIDAATDSKLSKEVRSAGGGGGGIYNDYDKSRNLIKDLDRKVNGPDITTPKGMWDEVTRILGKAYGGVEAAGRAIEYAPRLAEARAIKEAGGTIEDAARGARSVTVDFANFGKEGRVLNDYLLFLNTRLQGNKNVISAIKNNPKRAAVAITSNIAVPAASVYAWNTTQYPEVYDSISQDVKDNNFILVLGDKKDEKGNYDQVLKLPKNEPDKVFGNITESILAHLRGQPDKTAWETALSAVGSVLPIDTIKDGKFNLSRTAGSLLNPAIKAPIENVANHNLYFDSPIVPEGMEDLPDEMQVRDSTSTAAKLVSGLTGGSPIKTDSAIRSLTGNLFTSNPVSGVGDALTGARGGAEKDEFYKTLDKTAKLRAGASKRINEAIAAGDTTTARQIADEYNQQLAQSFKPWAEQHGSKATPQMQEMYDQQKLNLNRRAVRSRRRNARDRAKQEEEEQQMRTAR
jgi:hypothetical protein